MSRQRSPLHILPQAFPGIQPDEVARLVEIARVQKYPVGAVLCREDREEDTFYIILEGAVQVSKKINDQEERVLNRLSAGDFFGEMALIHRAPRSATITVIEDLTVMEIDRQHFHEALENSTAIARAMVHEISERLRYNDEMAIEDLRIRAAELAAAYERLMEADIQRQELLRQLAAELNPPVQAVLGYLDLIGKPEVGARAQAEASQRAREHVLQIVHKISDVLLAQDITLSLAPFEVVDLRDVLRQSVDEVRERAAARQIQIKVKTPLRFPTIQADPARLRRALDRLLDIALQHSFPRATIVLRLTKSAQQAHIHIETDSLLDPRVENLAGWQLAEQIVRQHGGQLTSEVTPDDQIRIQITLPQG